MNKIKENFYFLKTFGCQMSNLDSKYIQLLLNKMSFETKQIEKADIIVFNTCSIREASENKLLNLFSYISKMKEYNKDIFVAVLGCFVEKINYKFIQKHSYIDCFISPDYLHFLPYAFKRFHLKKKNYQLVYKHFKNNIHKNTIKKNFDFLEDIFLRNKIRTVKKKPREYIRIMKGCNKFCTYCVVPYTRGLEICRPIERIILEIKHAIYFGSQEIVLLGQSVNHYYYRGVNFYKLLYIISNIIPKHIRVKFLTSYPKNIIYPLLTLIQQKSCLSKYLHIPAQSGSNTILKKMNRCYTREEYLDIIDIAYAKNPGISIAGDMIVGFPDESTKDFQCSIALVKYVKYQHLFISQYSPRPNTISYLYYQDNVSKSIKRARHNYMFKIQQNIMSQYNSSFVAQILEGFVWKAYNTSVSKKLKEILLVKTDANKIIFVFDEKKLLGSKVRVRILQSSSSKIFGFVVK